MAEETDMIYLMAQISHEIRTPLNGIKGFGELLLDESTGELNETQKKYLTKMLDNTEKLSSIVERVLDWAKLETKQSELKMEEVNFNFLLWQVVDLLREKALKKNIDLSLTAQKDLFIYGDPLRLRELVINLADHALKYTPNGGKVEIKAEKSGEMLKVSVSDNGYGISDTQMKRLFQPFSRGQKRIGNEASSGLGLWICKLLVEMHHGTISCKSIEGGGSTCYVSLPVNER